LTENVYTSFILFLTLSLHAIQYSCHCMPKMATSVELEREERIPGRTFKA